MAQARLLVHIQVEVVNGASKISPSPWRDMPKSMIGRRIAFSAAHRTCSLRRGAL